MPLSNSDYQDILDYLRVQVSESNFRQLDEPLTMEVRLQANPRNKLEHYLSMLITMIGERSRTQARSIDERFRLTLDIEHGYDFQGVEVMLSDAERETFGIGSFSFHELDDVQEFLSDLKAVLELVQSEDQE